MKSRPTNPFIEYFAQIPFLWNVFEWIFGADKQKQILYRSKVGNSKKMMDFGCSSGNTTKAFFDTDYTGVDIDKPSIIHAKKKWMNYPNIKFVATDILLPNKNLGKFDDILFAGTGHHLSDCQLIDIFHNLDRYLNKGGEIHYIDTIKPLPACPFLTRWICSIDRGKFIRSKKQSTRLIKMISSVYKVKEVSVEKVKNTIIPQPSYIYFRLKLKKNV